MKVLKKSKGFTLVELIVVIAIIGILAAVLVPSITGFIDKAEASKASQEASAVYQVYQQYLIEKDEAGSYEGDFFSKISTAGGGVLIHGYYHQITGKDIFDGREWIIEITPKTITINEDTYNYTYIYRCDNGVNVYLDKAGVIQVTSKV